MRLRPFAVLSVAVAAIASPLAAQPASAYARAVDLSNAAMLGDTVRALRILETGLDPDSPVSNDGTALMTAAFYGRVPVARLLLARGADPLLEDKNGQTARDFAIRGGHRDLARLLEAAERGDDLPSTRTSKSGRSQFELAVDLSTASTTGDLAWVRRLLEEGADPNFKRGAGSTALHSAAWYGRLEVAKLLLEHGADPSLADDDRRTARDVAIRENHRDVASLLGAAMGIADQPRRRREPPGAAKPEPARPTPAKPAADRAAPARPEVAAPPVATGRNETRAPEEFPSTGVTPRAGTWKGTVSNQGGGKWTVEFTVAPNGDITEIEFDGDIRCSSGTVGLGREYGRSESAGYVTRGARIANQRGAFNGTYHDEKAGVHWHMQGAFSSPAAARGKLRIGAHAGQCDTWGLQFTAKRVG